MALKKDISAKKKEMPKEGKSITERQLILTDWLRKKRLQYEHRQSEEVFFVQLAKRLIEIVDKEPGHKIAKVLFMCSNLKYSRESRD